MRASDQLIIILDPIELDAKAKLWIKQFYETNSNVFFEHLVRNFDKNLLNFLKSQISDNNNKKFEDVASETWIKCYKALKNKQFDITAKNSFKTYLFSIAYKHNIDFWKSKIEKQSRDKDVSLDLYNEHKTESELEEHLTGVWEVGSDEENGGIEKDTLNKAEDNKQEKNWSLNEIKSSYQICLGKLPQEQQRVFVLRMDTEYTRKKIAQVASSDEETIKRHLAVATKKMIACVRSRFPDYFTDNN